MKKVKDLIKNKPEYFLFFISFFFLMILGLCLSYNYEIKNNTNLLFDSDTARVIKDAIEISGEHYRVNVHPLFVLIIQPTIFLLNGLFLDKMISLIFLSSLISSLSVVFIFKTLNKIEKNNNINYLISFIYLFSFSNMMFTAGIETYNFAAFFLILLWYYYVSKDKLNNYSYILLVLLGIFSFAFTITNIIIFGIVLLLLLINKKIDFKKAVLVGAITLVSVTVLNITQKLVWNNTPFFWKTNVGEETTNFGNNKIGLDNIKNVIKEDYSHSLLSSDINLKIKYGTKYNGQNYILQFQKNNILNMILLILFYGCSITLLIRNFKENKFLNIGLLLVLGFNTSLHLIYGNDGAFLYSLHFLYGVILLLGVNLLKEKNRKIKNGISIFLLTFLGIEIIENNIIFLKVLSYVRDVINKNYFVQNMGELNTILLEIGIIIICFSIVFLGLFCFKKIKKEKLIEGKIVWISSIVLLVLGLEWIFIILQSTPKQNQFLWIKLNNKEQEIIPKKKEDYIPKSFKEEFKNELKSLEEYEKEYDEFKKSYQVETTNDPNWYDYYYFGMANRRKLFYKPNKIVDINSKEEIYSFEEKEHYIIPNLYTVLIETINGDYIKIMEDKDGVHFIKNKKDTLIEGTNNIIDLYSFENEKFENIKKVLYGELLINIKDSKIYPNIIVYDNPWYRDAAITSMVLKKTNNTNLIKDWVDSITEIYDKQNNGVEEVDNLGELLFILSTQEEKNNELISRIEEEAQRIANENPNGYYLYGKTDFGDQYLYQNLWYKLGIESVGKEFHFDLNIIPEDMYSKMSWWSNYNIKETSPYDPSKEYPYLSYAARHKLGNGTIVMNDNIYPLSWESNASSANYENYRGIEDGMVDFKLSPLHSWSASELLLWILEETNE